MTAAQPAADRSRTLLPYFLVEIRRRVRDGLSLFFILGLPVAMYLLFGATSEYADESAGNGNVAFYILVSMAAYGAVTAMTSLTATVALEQQHGWQRQLTLAGLGTGGFIGVKVAMALLFTAVGTGAVLLVGVLTGARADSLGIWLQSLALILLTAPVFGVYGLAVALLFRSEAAVGVASAVLTLFAFFGNMFMPLSGMMLDIARFTPMYGIAALVRWPLAEGALTADDGTVVTEPLWVPIVNALVWLVIFVLLAALGARRRGERV